MADRHTLEELNNCSREELITIVLMMQGQLDTLLCVISPFATNLQFSFDILIFIIKSVLKVFYISP